MAPKVLAAAVRGARLHREANPFQFAVYVSAAVTALFLSSHDGQRLLKRADEAGRALSSHAFQVHVEGAPGHLQEYGWAMIRKLHPRSPGPLWLWGKEKHAPPADSSGVRLVCSKVLMPSCLDNPGSLDSSGFF